jgi:hypothetical protein
VLYAKSVDGLSFTGNKLIRSNRFKPFHSGKSTFTFENCSNILIKGNIYEGEILGKNVRLVNTSLKAIKIDKKEGLKINLHPLGMG